MPPVAFTQVLLSEPYFRPEDTRQVRFSIFRFLAWFLFFLYFSGVHQAIIYFAGIAGFFGLTQALVMSLLWLVPVMLFPTRSKLIAGIVGVVLWATSLFSMGYLALYRQDFSQSVIFIIFESNWAESSEFLQSYFAWWMLPALAVYTLIPWLIWRRLQPIGGAPVTRLLLAFTLGLAVCWPMLDRVIIEKGSLADGFDEQATRMEPVAPWQLVMGYVKYRQALSNVENQLLASDKPPLRFRIIVYPDRLSMQQNSRSFIKRHAGVSPWAVVGMFVALAGLSLAAVFYLSGKLEKLLAQSGKAEIYKVEKMEGGYAIAFGLGTEHGVHRNDVVIILDPEGNQVGTAEIREAGATDAVGLARVDQDIRPGYVVSLSS